MRSRGSRNTRAGYNEVMTNKALNAQSRLPDWKSFVKSLGPTERYERQVDLPPKVMVTRTRACWAKDGTGVHLFVDVTFEDRVSHWRVYMPKRHQNFEDVLAGHGIVTIGDEGSGLVVVCGGNQG